MRLKVTSERVAPGQHVLALTGEIDLYTSPEFKDELLRVAADGAEYVVIDLTETTFIDSTGLGVILRGVERLGRSGGKLVVVCTDRNIRKVFEVTGLDRVFTLYGERSEALAQAPSDY
jgi:anti-sigma B factor antagonist